MGIMFLKSSKCFKICLNINFLEEDPDLIWIDKEKLLGNAGQPKSDFKLF